MRTNAQLARALREGRLAGLTKAECDRIAAILLAVPEPK